MITNRFLAAVRSKTGLLFLIGFIFKLGRQIFGMLLNKFASLPSSTCLTAKMRVYYF